jgi:hypothetical protein
MKIFYWADKLPKRVGMPNKNASYVFRMSGVICRIEESLGAACVIFKTSSRRVSAILNCSL